MKKKISKHYNISEELIEELNNQKDKRFKTEVETVEYYLNKGLEKEIKTSDDNKINVEITKDLKYIKRLLEQLFANKKFVINNDIKNDECLNEFKNHINKDKFYE